MEISVKSFNEVCFCQKNIDNPHKKCVKFYKKINDNRDETVNKIIKCPYRFHVHVKEDYILRSIIFRDDADFGKLMKLISYNKNKTSLNKLQILTTKIYNHQLLLEDILSIFEYTFHDLRYHFSYLINMIDYSIDSKDSSQENKHLLRSLKDKIIDTRDKYLSENNKSINVYSNDETILKIKEFLKTNNIEYIQQLVSKYDDYYFRIHNLALNFIGYFRDVQVDFYDDMDVKERRLFTSLQSCVEFVSYRIDMHNKYIDTLKGIGINSGNIAFHNIQKAIYKIKSIMTGKLKKKNVSINLPDHIDYAYKLTNDIYLALFVLIENSITYTPMKKDINVTFEYLDDKGCIVTIENIGPKPGVKNVQSLLSRGVRGITNTKQHTQGKGLGLSLVRDILKDNNLKYNLSCEDIDDEFCVFKFSIHFFDGAEIV